MALLRQVPREHGIGFRVPITNALIRLRDGQQHVDELSRDLDRIAGRPVEIRRAGRHRQAGQEGHVAREQCACSRSRWRPRSPTVVLVGQSIVRLIAASATDLPVLGALGVTTRSTINRTDDRAGGGEHRRGRARRSARVPRLGSLPDLDRPPLEPSPGLSLNASVIGFGVADRGRRRGGRRHRYGALVRAARRPRSRDGRGRRSSGRCATRARRCPPSLVRSSRWSEGAVVRRCQ